MSWLPQDPPPHPGGSSWHPEGPPDPHRADPSHPAGAAGPTAFGTGTPGPGGPAPYRLPQGPLTPRRRRRRRPSVGFLVLVAALVFAGFQLQDRYPIHVGSLADVVAGRGPLIAVRPADFPPPGVDETAARLLDVPQVWTEDPNHAFIELQDLPDGTTGPVRWSPCRSIRYVVNTAGAPDGFAEVVAAEVARLSTATGLLLVDGGGTDEVPTANRAAYQPDRYGDRWAPVLIGFADLAEIYPDVPAAGIASSVSAQDPTTGLTHYVSGSVLLDRTLRDAPWYAGAPAYVPVLRHELGHLVGLDHVADRGQVMNTLTRTAVDYGDGDRSGLAVAGSGPCAPGL